MILLGGHGAAGNRVDPRAGSMQRDQGGTHGQVPRRDPPAAARRQRFRSGKLIGKRALPEAAACGHQDQVVCPDFDGLAADLEGEQLSCVGELKRRQDPLLAPRPGRRVVHRKAGTRPHGLQACRHGRPVAVVDAVARGGLHHGDSRLADDNDGEGLVGFVGLGNRPHGERTVHASSLKLVVGGNLDVAFLPEMMGQSFGQEAQALLR